VTDGVSTSEAEEPEPLPDESQHSVVVHQLGRTAVSNLTDELREAYEVAVVGTRDGTVAALGNITAG